MDFPETAIYRTPWLDLNEPTEVLSAYSWTSTKPSGTALDEVNSNYGEGAVVVLPNATPVGTIYGNVRRALGTDSIKYRGLLVTSGYTIQADYIALEFVLTQA